MSAIFQSHAGYFSPGSAAHGTACTIHVLLTRLSASPVTLMAPLAASVTTSIIAYVILCSAAIFLCFS